MLVFGCMAVGCVDVVSNPFVDCFRSKRQDATGCSTETANKTGSTVTFTAWDHEKLYSMTNAESAFEH
jgi:hypothetical protein